MEGSGDEPSCAADAQPRRHLSVLPPPQPPLKTPHADAVFRILCPIAASGSVIGKGGAVVRQIREESGGARIRVEDAIPGCDDCVVLVSGDCCSTRRIDLDGIGVGDAVSSAQVALLRVFQRISKVDNGRGGDGEVGGGGEGSKGASAVCRLLVPSSLVNRVLGGTGEIVEKIRLESGGAHVRVLPNEHLPAYASTGDELMQIIGSFCAVERALLFISGCLQDNSRNEGTFSPSTLPEEMTFRGPRPTVSTEYYAPSPRGYRPAHHASDYHLQGYASNPTMDNPALASRTFIDEEVVFRMLCTNEKVGSIIGKAGVIIRSLQSDTGAAIKVLDGISDTDEKVILISAHENPEFRRSPAQDAVLSVYSKLAPTDKASAAARLLVPVQQIGCLLGKGGNIITEMRRATGAIIRIFGREHAPNCAQPNDELVQVTGAFHCVQDALLHITGRIRDSFFHVYHHPGVGMTHIPTPPEFPALLRPRGDPLSPRHYVSPRPGYVPDHMHSHNMDWRPIPSNVLDHFSPVGVDQTHFPLYETTGIRPGYDPPLSPRSWTPLTTSGGNPRGGHYQGTSTVIKGSVSGSGSQLPPESWMTIKIMVPLHLLNFVYGDNNSNLTDIRVMSGAKVTIHDPEAGTAEGTVDITGGAEQVRMAQCLLHAFVLCGKSSA